jgi:murein endopeptidase
MKKIILCALFLFFILPHITSCKKKPPGKELPTSGKSTVGYLQLPTEGVGFYYFPGGDPPDSDNWGTESTIKCIQEIGKEWNKLYPKGPRLGIGDMSHRDDGPFDGHEGHMNGKEIDVRLFRKDREEKSSDIKNPDEYDRQLTKEAILLFIKKCKVKMIYFNDSEVIKAVPNVKSYFGHDNHFHVILE